MRRPAACGRPIVPKTEPPRLDEVRRMAGSISSLAERLAAPPQDQELAPREQLVRLAGEITERLLEIEAQVEALAHDRAEANARAVRWADRAQALEAELGDAQRWTNLGKVAAEIGSEIKNALSIVAARCEVLKLATERGETDRLPANFAAVATEIERANRTLVELVDLSQARADRRPLDLNAIVRAAVEFTASLNRYENIQFVPHLEEGLPPVALDLGQFQQLLINLFANGADAMGRRKGEGGRIWITTTHLSGERAIELRVRDEGPGVSDALRDRIFEPGFSLRDGRRGLGLAVARQIACAHDGTLTLAPKSENGAELVLRLPLA